jgi:uncharacterized lipoprotein YmbA
VNQPSMVIAIALLSGVAACRGTPAPRVYALNDAVDKPPAATPVSLGQPGLQLQRVMVPDYLDTTDILLRVGAHELHESTSGRWGERLSLGITRALRADLAARLSVDVASPSQPGANLMRQILVNVDAFDVRPGGRCVLIADWTILDTDRKTAMSVGRGTFVTPSVPGRDSSDREIVTEMADAVEQLSESIARAAQTLAAQGKLRDAMSNGAEAGPGRDRG